MNAERLLAHYEKIADAPDTIARLRRFILDLAVRGKLVPQDASDEPASEQLKRIAKEKAQFDRKERTKREPRNHNGEAEPIQLPKGWTLASLAELVSILNGRAYKQNELLSAGTPVLRVGNLFTSDRWYYSTLQLEEDKYCDKGDLIFAWSASFGPFIWTGQKVIYHYHIWKLPLHSEANLSKLYLYNFLLQKTREIKEAGHGISMIHMTKAKMELIQVPLPPLAEQHRIVAKVDELMGLCDRLEATRSHREGVRDRLTAASLTRLSRPDPKTFRADADFALNAVPALTARSDQIKALRQTVLSLAVCGKLVPQDPQDEPASELLSRITAERKRLSLKDFGSPVSGDDAPFKLPRGWQWTRIGDICSKTGSGSTPRGGKDVYKPSGVPFLRSQNVHNDRLRFDDIAFIDLQTHSQMKGTRVLPGDLLLNITGGSMGRCGRVPEDFGEANVSQHVAIIRPAVRGMDSFLHSLILSPYFQAFIFDEQTGAGMGGLPKNRMDNIVLALPPFAEQHRIVRKVDALMALCDELEASLATASTTRLRLLDALLQEALYPLPIDEAA